MTSRGIGIGAAGSSSAEGNSASHHLARAVVWTKVIDCRSSCLAQIFATAQQCRNPTQ